MSEVRTLLGLAWPVVLGQVGLVGMGVVDLMVAGGIEGPALAATGLGTTFSFASLIFGLGVCQGIDPDVTAAYGAGRPADAGRAAVHGAVLLVGVGVTIIGLHLVAAPVLTAFGQPADAIPGADTYARILALGVPPFLGFAWIRQILQGGGVMRPATWVILSANLVNLVADAVLVYGFGLGVAGLAWATVIVRWFMVFGLFWIGRDVLSEALQSWRIEWARVRRLARIAIPVGWQLGFEAWAFNTATLFAGWLGSAATAAHTASISAAALAFMVPMGLSAAATTRVGNLRGAEQPWGRAAAAAIGLGMGCMGLSGLVFAFAPHWVAAVFTRDPEEVALVVTVLPIAAVFGMFDGVQVVAMGVLRGLGDTRIAAGIALFAYWVVALPVSGLLVGWGLGGIWVGLSLGLGVAALLTSARVAWLAVRR